MQNLLRKHLPHGCLMQRHSTRTSCPAVKIGRHLSSQIAVDCERRGSVLSNVVGRILNF